MFIFTIPTNPDEEDLFVSVERCARAARHMKKPHLGNQKCKLYAAQAVPWYFGKGSPTLLPHGKCEKHEPVFA